MAVPVASFNTSVRTVADKQAARAIEELQRGVRSVIQNGVFLRDDGTLVNGNKGERVRQGTEPFATGYAKVGVDAFAFEGTGGFYSDLFLVNTGQVLEAPAFAVVTAVQTSANAVLYLAAELIILASAGTQQISTRSGRAFILVKMQFPDLPKPDIDGIQWSLER